MVHEVEPNYLGYNYRGLLSVSDRVNKPEDFFHESFIHEMTKQLSPLIAKTLFTTVGKLNKRETRIYINQYIQIICHFMYENTLFLHLSLLINNFGSTIFVIK